MLSRNNESNKSASLQALRALAFLGIFFSHANFFINWSGLGVSIFFVLSGFLLMHRYGEKELFPSIKRNLTFSVNRIRKLYPLHIITMLCTVVLFIIDIANRGATIRSVVGLLGKIAVNITLTQTWVPHTSINVSLNGVAWYLSVLLFLYFMFPYISRFIQSKKKDSLCLICIILLALQIVLCIPFLLVFRVDSPVYVWFMYCFPVFRLVDFFAGCVSYKFYEDFSRHEIGAVKATIAEITATIVTIFICLWENQEHNNILLQAIDNWTTLYIPLAVIWVILFAVNKGLISKILTNKLFVFIGNISPYLFLIHYVITQYVSYFVPNEKEIDGIERALLVLGELLISILLSIAYQSIHKKYIAPKLKQRQHS